MAQYVLRCYLSVVSQLTGKVFAVAQTRSLGDRLLKSATGTFGLRIASSGFSFLLSILLARLLGVAGYGTYSYVLAWVALLEVPGVLGLDRLLIREIAVYRTRSEWNFVHGLLSWSNRWVLTGSVVLLLLVETLIWILRDRLGFELSIALGLGLLLLPIVTLVGLRQAAMQGLNSVVHALLPEFVVRPLCLMALLGCAYFFFGTGLKPQWALSLNIVATSVALVVGTCLLHRMLPRFGHHTPAGYRTDAWIRSAVPMMLITGMNMISQRTDTVMLGTITGAEAVGIYTVAHRGAQLILLIQTAVNVALAPAIAALHAAGKVQQLQQVITKYARGVLAVSVSIALGLVLFSDSFLALFGPNFVEGEMTLRILAAGCVVNTAAGSVTLLLVMTGHERDAAIALGCTVALNLVLNATLIPFWGAEGAAVATSSSMMAQNLLMAGLVYARLGIHSTALGRIRLRAKV